jgi:hypothetical protein
MHIKLTTFWRRMGEWKYSSTYSQLPHCVAVSWWSQRKITIFCFLLTCCSTVKMETVRSSETSFYIFIFQVSVFEFVIHFFSSHNISLKWIIYLVSDLFLTICEWCGMSRTNARTLWSPGIAFSATWSGCSLRDEQLERLSRLGA